MLILTRKPGESLYIGDKIKITIVELKGHQIRVGIDAPAEFRIYREEIYLQILEENRKAAQAPVEGDIEGGLEGLSVAWSGRSEKEGEGGKKRPSALSTPISSLSSSSGKNPEIVVRKRRNKEDE